MAGGSDTIYEDIGGPGGGGGSSGGATRGEVVAAGTAIGGAIGANIALKSGAAVGQRQSRSTLPRRLVLAGPQSWAGKLAR